MPKYVGNRCIPIPEGNWDRTKEYDSLSVVLADNGDSYTSRKKVPAGVDLSDSRYWALSSRFNAQLAAETSARKQEIAVERARINNLTRLAEGSTTGDAELADLRVGVDGKVYDNAGEAVREQVSELKGDLSTLNKFASEKNDFSDVKNIISTKSVIKNGIKAISVLDNGIFLSGQYTQSVGLRISKQFSLQADRPYTLYIGNNDHRVSDCIIYTSESSNTLMKEKHTDGTITWYGDFQIGKSKNIYTFIPKENYDTLFLSLWIEEGYVETEKPLFFYIVEGEQTEQYFVEKVLREHDLAEAMERINEKRTSDFAHISDRYKVKNISDNIFGQTKDNVVDGITITSILDNGVLLSGVCENTKSYRVTDKFSLSSDKTYTLFVFGKEYINLPICVYKNDYSNAPLCFKKYYEDTQSWYIGNVELKEDNLLVFQPETDCDTATIGFWVEQSNVLNQEKPFYIYLIEGEYTEEDFIGETETEFIEEASQYGIPILKLYGNTTGISKDKKVSLIYDYAGLSGNCTLKWQGATSLRYPKKNYSIKFDNAFEAMEGWGAISDYVLKANWIDFSHSRNVVCAKLWGQIVKSRAIRNEHLYNLPNGGAIDGFPICLFINDKYQGIYTFNLAKKKYLAGMGSGSSEAIAVSEMESRQTKFEEIITQEQVEAESTISFEYASGDSYLWAMNHLNTLIQKCIDADASTFDTDVLPYVDLDSAIDYFIFVGLVAGTDMAYKNYLLYKYSDSDKWYFSAYDMDTTFGNLFDGRGYDTVEVEPTYTSFANHHRLMNLILKSHKDDVKARYAELRNSIMSESNVMTTFMNFANGFPKALMDEECKVWKTLPSTNTGNLSQILNYYRLRCIVMDKEIENL